MRSIVAAAVAVCCLGVEAVPVQAADFFAIIANLTNVKKPTAHVEVSENTDTAPMGSNISFTVFKDGMQIADFTVPTDANGFASSASAAPPNDNLFNLTGGEPALVRARPPAGATTMHAVLRQTLKPSNVILGIEPAPLSVGRAFPFTLGDVAHRAALLVADVSGADVAVDVFLGTTGCPGCGKYTASLRDNQVAIVEIDPADARSHLIISSTGDTVAQFVLDTGKKTSLTEVTMVPIH